MILAAIKYTLALLIGGGIAVPFISAWLKRREGRIQPIPLIERVNRLVDPKLDGFTLARVISLEPDRRLEEVQRVRELQLTLRNTSSVHLHNCEIQFDFPTAKVDAWAERPVRSKTSPIPTEPVITTPWKRGFRWRIPEFPSTDSIEFTFRTVDAESEGYEVALYNAGQVVIERSEGEPPPSVSLLGQGFRFAAVFVTVALLLIEISFFRWSSRNPESSNTATVVDWAGCALDVESDFYQVNSSMFSRRGPWSVSTSILNTGESKCFVQLSGGDGTPEAIDPGGSLVVVNRYTDLRPRLRAREILFGPIQPINRATVTFYTGASK